MGYDAAFWDRYFQHYDALNAAAPYRDLLDRVSGLCASSPEDLVLDAGTGTGNLLGRLHAAGARVVALDANPHGLRAARQKEPGTPLVWATLEAPLPFRDGAFDAVTMVNVLYTLSDRGRSVCLAEVRRVLEPGGRLVIADPVPGYGPLPIYAESIRGWLAERGLLRGLVQVARFVVPTVAILVHNREIQRREGKRRYRFLSPGRLVEELREAGFRVEAPERAYARQVTIALAHSETR